MINRLLLSACFAVGFANFSYGAVTVSDSFNYGLSGDVAGSGGGGSFGFADNWSGDSTFDVASGSLAPTIPFPPPVGNRVTADAFDGNRNIVRTLAQPIGADNTTSYISFLMQAEDVVGAGAYNGWFSFTLRSDARNVTIGKESFSNKYKVEGSLGDIALSDVDVVANQVHVFVLRADFLPGADVFRLYIDPPTGQAEPLLASATMSTFDVGTVTTIGLDGPGAFGFDELRIGSIWRDVAPAPEPSTFVLLGIGGVAIGRATRWRRGLGRRRCENVNRRHAG
jgi:hypothetical protein